MDLKSKSNPKNYNNKQSDQNSDLCCEKEKKTERKENIQSPRESGAPVAALTATSRAISDG